MQSQNKPNVIFFMVDQMGAKWLEAAMNGICDLPNLKRLQSMGVTFSNAFSNNPVCCPARAGIATGLTSRAHGLLSNGYRLNPDIPTFMKTLQMAGWRTGAFGKIHFYPFDSEYYPYPDYREYGWDVVHNTEDNRTGEWHDWIEKEHPEHYDAIMATPANWNSQLPYYDSYGEQKVNLTERMRRAKKEMAWAKGDDGGNKTRTEGYYPLPFPEEISQTNWITEHALNFIDETPDDQPLYTHISYVQPHPPFHPPARFLEMVNEDLIPDPVGYGTDHWNGPDKIPNWRYYRKLYFADFIHLDEQIGRILERLEQVGRMENSYFIFVSDHGEMLMDHNLGGKSARHYDAVIRIPLIVAGPGLKQGSTCDLFVQHEDICPTILDMHETLLKQHPRPLSRRGVADDHPLCAGRSLMPLCKGEQVSDWRQSVFSESFGGLCESPFREGAMKYPWKQTLRNREFRYSVAPGRDDGEELFDLTKDPGEFINVVHDPAYRETRYQLMKEMMHRVMLQEFPLPPRDLVVIGAH